MKKTRIFVIAAILIAAGIGIWAYLSAQKQAQIYGVPELSITVTDESWDGLEQYTALKAVDFQNSTCYGQMLQFEKSHPDISVTYRVDVGGTALSNRDADAELSAGSFDYETLLENLSYLPQLQSLSFPRTDLTAEQLETLRSANPELTLTWTVAYQGAEIPCDAPELTLENAAFDQIAQLLPYLPQLTDVSLTGSVPSLEEMASLKETFATIRFHWDFTLFGVPTSADAKEIDLSGIPMESVDALEAALPFFNRLEKVILCDSGLPSEEIDALWKRHPETRFVWNVQLGRFNVRTDITYLMPFQHGYYGTDDYGRMQDHECTEMKYLVDLVCLDMGHMYITDISFVKYMPKLEYFIIGDSRVTDLSPLAGAPKLKYLEAFYSGVEDITPLAQCPALEDVNICHNRISDFSPLLELKNLKNIWIAGNTIYQADREALEAAFPEAKIIYNLSGSTGAGWRQLPNYYAMRDILGMGYMAGG